MKSMPTLKDTDPHDVFAIESLLHAHAEKMPHAEKAPPLAHDPAAPRVHVAPPVAVGAPVRQAEPKFSAPDTPDIQIGREIAVENVGAGEIKVDGLKILEERQTPIWVRRAFLAALGLVGAIGAAAWQHYGDDAKAMAAEWTPPFLLAALPTSAKPALAEQPDAPATETAAADQAAQPAAAPVEPEPAAAAAAVPPAPSADTAQLQSMAQDLAAMGKQVEELKATIAQLKASQAQMARELTKASETKASETRPQEARTVAAPPPAARPVPPPVRKPKPVSSYSPSHSPAPVAAAAAAPPPPVQIGPPPRETIAGDGEPVVRPPMPLR
jgi:hypothetical protein